MYDVSLPSNLSVLSQTGVNSPLYELSRFFPKKLDQLAPLPPSFNIKNTQDLLKTLEDNPMFPHYNPASLDITNVYSRKRNHVNSNQHSGTKVNSPPQTQQQLLNWFDVIKRKNYFAHKTQIVIQHDGIAMGASTSGLIAKKNLFTTHRALTRDTRDTQTQIHKLVQICG